MKQRNHSRSRISWVLVSLSRGLAFFFGVYTALSLIGVLFGSAYNANNWWIDLDWLPQYIAWSSQALVALALLAFCFHPPRKLLWRIINLVIFGFFALVALQNAFLVNEAVRLGTVRLGFPVPFSLFIMLAFLILMLAVLFSHRVISDRASSKAGSRDKTDTMPQRCHSRRATIVIICLSVLLCGVAFPLGQLFCFGLSDYRTSVDAVVVFGAKVHPDGLLSASLANRVDAGIELYQEGYTPLLIMSGGTGVEGINEAEAMRDYAIKRGVPASAILVDSQGNSTELTVEHTISIAERQGFQSIGAVSSFYHLARIKMLFLSQGYDVPTVPASSAGEGAATYIAAVREIPGWWFYWFTSIF